jgi:hypothetical protein
MTRDNSPSYTQPYLHIFLDFFLNHLPHFHKWPIIGNKNSHCGFMKVKLLNIRGQISLSCRFFIKSNFFYKKLGKQNCLILKNKRFST